MCGRPNALDKDWHEKKAREAESLPQAAREVTDAREAVRAAIAAARRLVSLDEALLKRAEAAGLEEQARAALRHSEGAAWTTPEESTVTPDELATSIEQTIDPLTESLTQLRHAAQAELAAREDAWRPHALALAEWLPTARKAKKDAESLPNLKAAEKWLKGAADAIRNERFAPIADHARRIWDQLKLQSNVSLEEVYLGGSGKARKVELKVTVDGQEGSALWRDEPGRAPLSRPQPLHPTGHAFREPLSLRRHRRPRPVDGPDAGRWARQGSRGRES